MPVKALSPIFRAKFREALKQTELFVQVPAQVWQKDWVVHSESVGSGQQALQYLAPYIFRVAISNNRIRSLDHGAVTFSYKESATDQLKRCTVTANLCLRPQKKPASVAGFLFLMLYLTRLIAHLSPRRRASPLSHVLKLITQTPSNL